MPKRFERHRRIRDDYGSQPRRGDAVEAQVTEHLADGITRTARRAPGPKDTRSWCKGKRGRRHVPELTLKDRTPRGQTGCGWAPMWHGTRRVFEAAWYCAHRETCGGCGKVLRENYALAAAECPSYPGTDGQRAAAEVKAAQWTEERQRRSVQWPRRRVITGPTGYRRKRT